MPHEQETGARNTAQGEEEFLAQAREVQKRATEEKRAEVGAKLQERERLIADEREADREAKQQGGKLREVDKEIGELEAAGEEVVPEMREARKRIADAEKQAKDRVESGVTKIGELQADPKVYGAMWDEAHGEQAGRERILDKQKQEAELEAQRKMEDEKKLEILEGIAKEADRAAQEVTDLFREDNGWNLAIWDRESGQERIPGATSDTLINEVAEHANELQHAINIKNEEITKLKASWFKAGLRKAKQKLADLETKKKVADLQYRHLRDDKEKMEAQKDHLFGKIVQEIERYSEQRDRVAERVIERSRDGRTTNVKFPSASERFPYVTIVDRGYGSGRRINLEIFKIFQRNGYNRRAEMLNRIVSEEEKTQRLKNAALQRQDKN